MNPDKLLEQLVKSIVDSPAEVHSSLVDEGSFLTLRLSVNAKDNQKLTSSGAYETINTILKAVGGKLDKRIELHIEDNNVCTSK